MLISAVTLQEGILCLLLFQLVLYAFKCNLVRMKKSLWTKYAVKMFLKFLHLYLLQRNQPSLTTTVTVGNSDASKALAAALNEKVCNCCNKQALSNCKYVLTQSVSLSNLGWDFITSLTTRRKTLVGEECPCSSAEKNWGAPEELTTSILLSFASFSDHFSPKSFTLHFI